MTNPDFAEVVVVEQKRDLLYKKIKADKNPIFIWGCGALAEKTYAYCKKFGITVAGCFVNIVEKRENFKNLRVWRFEDLLGNYSKFSVIIGHSNYVEGTEYLKTIRNVTNIYCPASCCCGICNPISLDFIKYNTPLLNQFYNDLRDEESRQCLKTYFESRINDRSEYMFSHFVSGTNYYLNDVITLTENEVLLDIGACVGNAIWSFVDAVKGKYCKIIALEPDNENYRILQQNIEDRGVQSVTIKKVCAYSENRNVRFSGDKESGGIDEADPNYQIYPAITIDSLCEELGAGSIPSIIKINFPSSVSEILHGAKHLIRSSRPKIIIRAAYDENVLLKTYKTIRQINPDYQVYLRYTIGIPQGLTIFAI